MDLREAEKAVEEESEALTGLEELVVALEELAEAESASTWEEGALLARQSSPVANDGGRYTIHLPLLRLR